MTALGHKIPAPTWQIFLMGLLGLTGIVFIPLLIRLVDTEVLSTVLVAQVYVYYLVVLTQFGFGWTGAAALARSTSEREVFRILKASIVCKLLLLFVPVVLLFGVGYSFVGNEQTFLWTFGLLLGAYALNSNWFLQARGDFASGVGFALVGVVASLGLLILVGLDVGSSTWWVGFLVVLILTLPQVLLGLGSWWRAKGSCEDACDALDVPIAAKLKPLIKDAPLVCSQLLLLASTTMGTLVVGSIADADTSAAYAATEKLFNLGATVLVGLYTALHPKLARCYYDNRKNYWAQLGSFLGAVALSGVALLGILAVFGEPLFEIYLSAHLADIVFPVLLPFGIWLILCLGQHALIGYLVFAEQNLRVLILNLLVLAVTILVGYGMALLTPVAWVYGMIVGQLLAVAWLVRFYRIDARSFA